MGRKDFKFSVESQENISKMRIVFVAEKARYVLFGENKDLTSLSRDLMKTIHIERVLAGDCFNTAFPYSLWVFKSTRIKIGQRPGTGGE